ncbi:MAG TPA: hypothetical protein VFP58_02395 [Candidatus Eisenbacteria bacterium]|nr:hypothetical protein [Candidatus Eisenbacteria bacterium]
MIENEDSGRVTIGSWVRHAAVRASRRTATPLLVLLVAGLAAFGCQKRLASGAWEIVPGQRIGLVNRTEGEIDLQMGYGAQNVRPATVQLGEGETASGTVVFPDDSTQRIEVLWHDTAQRRYPAAAILAGTKSQWQLPRGITLGTTLHDLERMNGRPFFLAGFGWDYAGAVLSWNGGSLDSIFGTDTRLFLRPPPDGNADAHQAQAMGDRPFSSSSHPMRAINPRVARIRVEFPPPGAASPPSGSSASDEATDTLSTGTAGRDTSAASVGEGRTRTPLEIREDGNGLTYTYPVSTRFTLFLDERRNPGHTLMIEPEGIIGRIASVPSVDPPLYAVRFEAARPGRATIRSRGFVITVVVTEASQAPRP